MTAGPSCWVELRGFEPLTPSMRTRCATGLRHSPNKKNNSRSWEVVAHGLSCGRRPGTGAGGVGWGHSPEAARGGSSANWSKRGVAGRAGRARGVGVFGSRVPGLRGATGAVA